MSIGDNIKALRTAKGLKQSELADLANISRVSIGNYERGDRIPDVEIGLKLSEALGVSIGTLVGEKDKGGIKLNNLQEAAIKEYVNSIIKTYEDMYLDQRKKYSLEFKTEYIETKQMGYENRLDLDRILLELETPPVKLEVGA